MRVPEAMDGYQVVAALQVFHDFLIVLEQPMAGRHYLVIGHRCAGFPAFSDESDCLDDFETVLVADIAECSYFVNIGIVGNIVISD
jgi:hypothetical protein